MKTKEVKLKNDRRYLIIDTGKPYINGEYPIGGFIIKTWINNDWFYIDNSPSQETVDNFLKAAERL